MIPVAHKDALSFKYISDGSGRDFYVAYNSGGLQAPYIPGALKSDAAFISSLRNIEKRNKIWRFSSPKEREQMKRSLLSQKLLVKRLTSNNSEWKQINKDLKSNFLKSKSKLINLNSNNSYDYGKYRIDLIFKWPWSI